MLISTVDFRDRRREIRQIFTVICGSLIGVSFGMMLGWTSVVFPGLLDESSSPVLIIMDQTSLIAGFLMEGNIAGILISHVTYLGSKQGVLFSCCCQVIGWLVMFVANNVPAIGISRILIGFGNGFGTGQLKVYVQETCEPELAKKLTTYLPISVNAGIILVYIIGPFASFRSLSLICAVVPLLALIAFGLIPKRFSNYTIKKLEIAKSILATESIDQIKNQIHQITLAKCETKQIGFITAVKNRTIRNAMVLVWFISTIQQYSGGPANLIYAQIIHQKAWVPYSQFTPIIYGSFFLIFTVIAINYSARFPRKPLMVFSCTFSAIFLFLTGTYFYFHLTLLEESVNLAWFSLILLIFYNFFHTIGLSIIPTMVIGDLFPPNAKVVGAKVFLINFSISAILSTKFFQMLFYRYDMYTAYAFLAAVALTGALVSLVTMKETRPKIKDVENMPNTETNCDISSS